ncbi:MAG: hypothetical protein K2N71_12965 [Oscillospiraceae bacterium]|nr:hypothetical protein [Oscillospiraceae bacterium]
MQDKSLDAMAKKYKEEMMRLYSKQPESGSSASSKPSASGKPPASSHAPQAVTVKPDNNAVNGNSQQTREQTAKKDTERLMHPPMPQIPNVSTKCEEKAAENTQGGKFPSPEELMAGITAQETVQNTAQNEITPRFDRGQEQEHALDQGHEHEQGNYDFTEAERERMFDDGEGYLKLEVSGGGQPLDCDLAAVFRVTDCGDVLTATFFTDAKGETEVITLPVLGLDEKYTVTVAKEGFYTVHSLEIPIFDSIKSIQPVELKKEQK